MRSKVRGFDVNFKTLFYALHKKQIILIRILELVPENMKKFVRQA
jgi:hypothetical protein